MQNVGVRFGKVELANIILIIVSVGATDIYGATKQKNKIYILEAENSKNVLCYTQLQHQNLLGPFSYDDVHSLMEKP